MLAVSAWPGASFAEAAARRDLRLAGPVPAAAAFAAAAELWGFDLTLEEGLRPVELRVDLEGVTREEALDLLSAAAGSFWWVSGDGATHVAPDTPDERRKGTARVRRSYRLEHALAAEVVTALRTLLSARGEASEDGVEAEVWEPAARLADEIVAAMDGAAPAGWSVRWLGSELVKSAGAPDPRLGAGAPQRLWFPEGAPAERLHRAVESAWNVDLVLDPAIVDPGVASLRLPSATLFEALDALTVPVGLFWTPLGGRRILLAEDGPVSRRRWVPIGLASFRLQRADPVTVRRVLRELGLRATATGSSPPVVLVRDTPLRLAVAELVLETLEGEGPLASPAGGRLWLGTRTRPRLADAQGMVDPATADERRRALAAAAPPELAAGPRPDSRRNATHWGVAAIPLGAQRAAVWELVEELGLDAAPQVLEPHPFLFATGRWDDLGALLAAAAGSAAGREEAAPRPSSPPIPDHDRR